MLTAEQVADRLNISTATLASWRGRTPSPLPFVRIGATVRYPEADVVAALERLQQGGQGVAL